jgi:hypothetical protein
MLEVDVCARRPELFLDVFSGDYLARSFEEHDKYTDRLTGELDPKAVLPQFARLDIELEWSKAEDPAGGARFGFGCRGRHGLT